MIFVKIKIKAWNKGLVDYLAININRGKKFKKKKFLFQKLEGDLCDLHDGSKGICTYIERCRLLRQGFKYNRIPIKDITTCSFKVTLSYLSINRNFNSFNNISDILGIETVCVLWRYTSSWQLYSNATIKFTKWFRFSVSTKTRAKIS